MLPKSKRLNLKKDFKWVASGKKIDTKFAKLFIRMGDPSTHSVRSGPLVGIAVASSIFKKATERNRARRVLSASLEPLYSRLPKSINIIALPKISILSVKSGDVLLDLEETFKNNNLLIAER